jgi:putative ABC transport system substrate-binding protein
MKMTRTFANLFRLPVISVVVVFLLTLAACTATQPSAPAALKIGILSGGAQFDNVLTSIKATMNDLGFTEGKNVTYTYDSTASAPDRLASMAQTLVDSKVDLIFALGTPAAQAAQKATAGTAIPVVFGPLSDPVQIGLVKSLTNPGGNITGVSTGLDVHGKRLEYLTLLKPDTKRVYLPYDPADVTGAIIVKSLQAVAQKLGVTLVLREVHSAAEMTSALNTIPDDVDAVFIVPSTLVAAQLNDLVKASTDHKIPVCANVESQINQGVLLTYSFSDDPLGKQIARIGAKVLNGTKPADIPVETSEFFLAVNLKTARAINLTVPDSILLDAHVIIR